jgi:hypothetical protein
MSHLDALWETASEVAGPDFKLNPAEAFVFGGAVLLHDAGLCAAAYRGGLDEIKRSVEWRDCAAQLLKAEGYEPTDQLVEAPPVALADEILFAVLRDRHASQAELLATMSWPNPENSTGNYSLISSDDLRTHYGESIGQIAHSHHWPISRVENELQSEIPAVALSQISVPSDWVVDCRKIACLLRVADAAHIDARRAPRQYRIIASPTAVSKLHWIFQERLGKPRLDPSCGALRYGSGKKFELVDADAWWLCFDTIQMIDQELHDSDKLLQALRLPRFAATRVLDAETASALARHIQPNGWVPVDARVKISDVTSMVRNFGGARLYGKNPSIALRELIQNAADGVRARRKLERAPSIGKIIVRLVERKDGIYLEVEDDGVGMSEFVLTGPLLDFGNSFWRHADLRREWPGLAGSSFRPTGKFGIGFFSTFMLGDQVTVTSRKCVEGLGCARTLEFRHGLNLRPILRSADDYSCLLHGGTCVAVKLNENCHQGDKLLYAGSSWEDAEPKELSKIVQLLSPSLDVDVWVESSSSSASKVISASDWQHIDADELLIRTSRDSSDNPGVAKLIRPILNADGRLIGRAALGVSGFYRERDVSVITVGGLRAGRLEGIVGLFEGTTDELSRNGATILASPEDLEPWAREQEKLQAALKVPVHDEGGAAQIIMSLGVTPNSLRWVSLENETMSTSDFSDRVTSMQELIVTKAVANSSFAFTTLQDDFTAKQLLDEFVPGKNVAQYLGDAYSNFDTLESEEDYLIERGKSLPLSSAPLVNLILRIVIESWGKFNLRLLNHAPVGKIGTHDVMRSCCLLTR